MITRPPSDYTRARAADLLNRIIRQPPLYGHIQTYNRSHSRSRPELPIHLPFDPSHRRLMHTARGKQHELRSEAADQRRMPGAVRGRSSSLTTAVWSKTSQVPGPQSRCLGWRGWRCGFPCGGAGCCCGDAGFGGWLGRPGCGVGEFAAALAGVGLLIAGDVGLVLVAGLEGGQGALVAHGHEAGEPEHEPRDAHQGDPALVDVVDGCVLDGGVESFGGGAAWLGGDRILGRFRSGFIDSGRSGQRIFPVTAGQAWRR
jgi:hypothetical protein